MCLLKAHGTLVKAACTDRPRGSGARCTSRRSAGSARTRSASRRSTACASTASQHYLDLASAGRVDLTGMLTHTFALDDWRDAFYALADQERLRGDQGRHRPAFMTATARPPARRWSPRRRSARPRRPSGPHERLRGRLGLRPRHGCASPTKATVTGAGGDGAGGDRELDVLLVPPDARLEAIEVVVSVTGGVVRSWEVREGMRPALLFGESFTRSSPSRAIPTGSGRARRPAASPTWTRSCRSTRGRQGRSASRHEDGPPHRPLHRFYRASPTPTTATRARSKGCIAIFDTARARCSRCVDLGVVPLPPEPGLVLPRGQRAPARRPDAARDRAAGGAELHRRRQPGAVAALVVPCRLRSARGSRAAHRRLRRRRVRTRRSCTARRSARWSCPTATPAPIHGWKNAFDAGEWGLGRMANSLDARVRLPRRDPLLRRRHSPTSTVSRTPSANAICLHEEDYGILWKHVDQRDGTQRGAPLAAAGRELRSRRSATTSTASTGTSTSTAPSSSR